MSQCNLMLDLICHGGMLTPLSHRMIGPFELVDFKFLGILILSMAKGPGIPLPQWQTPTARCSDRHKPERLGIFINLVLVKRRY